MGYEDQLKQAERILDKMNAAMQGDGTIEKRLDEVEVTLAVFVILSLIQLVAVAVLVIVHLVG